MRDCLQVQTGRCKGERGSLWFLRRGVSAGASAACGYLVAAGLVGKERSCHKLEPRLISSRKQLSQTAPGPSAARWMAVSEASRALSFLHKRRPVMCEIQTVPSRLLFLPAFISLV